MYCRIFSCLLAAEIINKQAKRFGGSFPFELVSGTILKFKHISDLTDFYLKSETELKNVTTNSDNY